MRRAAGRAEIGRVGFSAARLENLSVVAGILGTQPVEDSEGGLFRAGGEIAGGADAGGAALLAGARGDEFAGFLYEKSVRSKEGFGEADSAGVGVEEIKIWFEEFLGIAGDGVLQPSGRAV